MDDPYEFAQIDNKQHISDLQSKGVTKFAETDVDNKFLDWTNEEDEQQEAINEALEKQGRSQSSRGGSANNQRQNGASASGANRNAAKSEPAKSQKKPSAREQMDSGIIRRYSNR